MNIEEAIKLFGREDLLGEYGIQDTDTNIEVFMSIKDMVKYYRQDLEIERLNNIINIILDFNLFKDECPLCLGYLEKCDEEKAQDVFYEEEYCENCSDDYKKCWLKYFNRLQELKGSDKE